MEIDSQRLILIVTGAHLRAEAMDRPVAYRLQAQLARWLEEQIPLEAEPRPCQRILVCSDLWYLNNDGLRNCPTISLGGPRVNALTAFLADKLPSAFAIEDLLLVQADLDFPDVVACCWGRDGPATAAAADAFAERYLPLFMNAATRQWA
jgi:hypothetical protein